MPEGSIADRFATLIAGFDLAQCPPDTIGQARLALLDTVGCMVAGSQSPLVDRLLAVLGPTHGPCLVPGRDGHLRLPVLDAALVNGTAAHILELDDGYTPGSAHPGCVVGPTALALGESEGASLGRVLEAVIVGYEVMLSVSGAIHPESRRRGFHNTAIAGVFGAAAAAARLLGLDPREACHALGLAGSFAGGLLAFWNPGEQGATDVKKLHPGKAARDGIFCALSAAQGIHGPASVFEGKAGFLRAFADKGVIRGKLFDLASPRIMDIYFKPWPCCRSLHGPIALALRLGHRVRDRIGGVGSIRVDTYSLAADRSEAEAGGDDAQFSIPMTVALALTRGEVAYPGLVAAHQDARLTNLAKRIEVHEDAEFTKAYPRSRPARLTIWMEDGETLSESLAYPPGEPQQPLPQSDLLQKFLGNCLPVIGDQAANQVADFLTSAGLTLPISGLTPTLTATHQPSPPQGDGR
ncbi:MAG TPA: MmgE/PrpD family protein [Bacillota bacterium]